MPTGARCLAGDRDVRATEMTLIGEPDVERDLGKSTARPHQQLLRYRNPLANDVMMRRVAGALLERAIDEVRFIRR